MALGGKRAAVLLFLGDVAVFVLSLWLTLFIRYAEVPSVALFIDHIRVFAGLFILWPIVFYMAGLYSKRARLFKSALPSMLMRTQLLNVALAALLFFLVPTLGIAPKTNLAIYLIVSLIGVFLWRLWIFPRWSQPALRERAIVIGEGDEVDALVREVNENPRYHIVFQAVMLPRDAQPHFDELLATIVREHVSMLIVDVDDEAIAPILPRIYDTTLMKRECSLVHLHDIYEEVFDRVPLSLLRYEWFLKNFSAAPSMFYTWAKRAIDIAGGVVMGLVTLIALPLVYIAMKIEDGGPLFIAQERFGQFGSRVSVLKFRSMSFNDKASGTWLAEDARKENRVTRVGSFLRKTSLDEFPQFINILRGELSLIGPRNDIVGLGERLAQSLPFYMTRYLVKPGITGWAQINQQYEQGNISPQSIEETKTRLAYDFYYMQHRSFGLDILIALRTVKRMLFRVSSW